MKGISNITKKIRKLLSLKKEKAKKIVTIEEKASKIISIKEEKTEKVNKITIKENKITTMDEEKWNNFLEDDVKKYYQQVKNFLDELQKFNPIKIKKSYFATRAIFGVVINKNADFSSELSRELKISLLNLRDIWRKAYQESVELCHPKSSLSFELINELEKKLLEFKNKFYSNS